jgi:hypothetical protein
LQKILKTKFQLSVNSVFKTNDYKTDSAHRWSFSKTIRRKDITAKSLLLETLLTRPSQHATGRFKLHKN